ncbi:MAG: hypothetical protein M3349_01875, partial [Actinomycetota bacterium]|nr:hypothetical protein [Actinomycetota bacterium]
LPGCQAHDRVEIGLELDDGHHLGTVTVNGGLLHLVTEDGRENVSVDGNPLRDVGTCCRSAALNMAYDPA